MSVVLPIEVDDRVDISTAAGGETVFAISFPFQDAADVTIIKELTDGSQITLASPADYSITGAGNPAGGSVTLTLALTAGQKCIRAGNAVLERLTSITRAGAFSSAAIDADLDRNRIIQQEQRRDIARSLKTAYGSSVDITLPAPAASRVIMWNETATGLKNGENPTDAVQTILDALAQIEAIRDEVLAAIPPQLVDAPITYYVNGATGNDSNSGLTALLPFATIQKAINVVGDTLLISAKPTILVADGTYNENLSIRRHRNTGLAGTNNPTIKATTPHNVIIDGQGGTCATGVGAETPWTFEDIKFQSALGSGVYADFGATIYCVNCDFGDFPAGNAMVAGWHGKIECIHENFTVSGDMVTLAFASRGGLVLSHAVTCTLSGTPAFSAGVAIARDTGSIIDLSGITWSGTATGKQARFGKGARVVRPDLLPGNDNPLREDLLTADRLVASALSLTTATPADLTALVISEEGEYEIFADACFRGGATTTVDYFRASVSTASATHTSLAHQTDKHSENGGTPFALINELSAKVRTRLSFPASSLPQTIYLVGEMKFGVSTGTAFGSLRAERVQSHNVI